MVVKRLGPRVLSINNVVVIKSDNPPHLDAVVGVLFTEMERCFKRYERTLKKLGIKNWFTASLPKFQTNSEVRRKEFMNAHGKD